eukprot:1177654-Prorocentrum_minimum.AAC.4
MCNSLRLVLGRTRKRTRPVGRQHPQQQFDSPPVFNGQCVPVCRPVQGSVEPRVVLNSVVLQGPNLARNMLLQWSQRVMAS